MHEEKTVLNFEFLIIIFNYSIYPDCYVNIIQSYMLNVKFFLVLFDNYFVRGAFSRAPLTPFNFLPAEIFFLTFSA